MSHLVSINKLTHGQEIDRWRFPTLKLSKYWLPNTHTWFNASLFSSYLCLRRCSHTSDLHIWAIPEYIYLYLNKHPISKYIFFVNILMYIFHDKMTLVKLKNYVRKLYFTQYNIMQYCLFSLMHEHIMAFSFKCSKHFVRYFSDKCQNYFVCVI